LKWVGGKRQLLPALRRFYPGGFDRYVEPFFGSGAVFFDLHRQGLIRDRPAILIDSNADLIGCYTAVRDRPDEVLRALKDLAAGHEAGARAHYYAVRDDRFNPARQRLRQPDGSIDYGPELAAMLIYLNRTGFNGLFRVNARGAFNVPAGRYERPRIVQREKVLRVAEALSRPGVELRFGTYQSVEPLARRGDFLYFDPPYAPISRTSSFTAYTPSPFDRSDQEQLQRLVVALAHRGCRLLLSNSTASEIGALYDGNAEARAAGLVARRVPARRAVNSNARRRGAVEEYLITNIEERSSDARQPDQLAALGAGVRHAQVGVE